jgi:trans-aconitate methyltransferase
MWKTIVKPALREVVPPFLYRGMRASLGLLTRREAPGPARQRDAAHYDQTFEEHDQWKIHYTQSRYYPVWTVVADRLIRRGVRSVLDIGCGPGQVGELLHDRGITGYIGIDFSAARIAHARQLCPTLRFEQRDVLANAALEEFIYDACLCLEFLEHVDRDKEVLRQLRPGTYFLGTVPDFPYMEHVRHFRSAEEVSARYAECFQDFRVDPIVAGPKRQTFFLMEGEVR